MKKTQTSSKKQGRPVGTGKGKKIPGTNKVIIGTSHGEDPKLIVESKENIDLEATMEVPSDELSRHQYPPSKKHPTFRKIWGQFIDSVVRRENFNIGHLNSLEILCDLFVEYEELNTFIRKKGRSYQSFGRSGMTWKIYPEVSQLKSVQHQINVYMKQLGFVLRKDDSGISDGDMGEWS